MTKFLYAPPAECGCNASGFIVARLAWLDELTSET
jgi:hypothetical protein